MAIPRLFVTQTLIVGQTVILDPSVEHHLHTVLRLQPQAQLILFNGTGGEYEASVITFKPCTVQIRAHHTPNTELPNPLEWAQGWCQFEKMDWVVQKATELGVQCISLIRTQKTKLKQFDIAKKERHWQKIIEHSVAQCGRTQLPQLKIYTQLEQWIQTPFQGQSYFASLTTAHFTPPVQLKTPIRFLIGPEGGLHATEIAQLQAAECTPVSLGARTLRTETAGIVLATLILHHQGLC